MRWASGAFAVFAALVVVIGCGKISGAATDTVATRQNDAPLDPTGSLDPALIKSAIAAHRDLFRGCYERELAHFPALGGEIRTQFVIGLDADVVSSAVKNSTMGNAAV